MEGWFASLPQHELLPLEVELRTVLLNWLHYKAGPFPLSEWVDRRIGGEVETRSTPRGVEIFLRGTAPPAAPPPGRHGAGGPPAAAGRRREASADDFFASLPKDNFSPQEDALRDAVFEFLATWEYKELATLVNLCEYPGVRQARAFLPSEVPLKMWLERRIGGELDLKPGPRGQDVVHLHPSAKEAVMQKAGQLKAAARQHGVPPHLQRPGAMGKGGKGGPPPPKAGPEPGEKGGGKHQQGVSQEEWLGSLPADELTPEELALRQAILNYINAQKRNPSLPTPTISDLAGDTQVSKCRLALMPSKVKLRIWIERRIGGEVELVKGPQGGESLVMLRGDAAKHKAAAAAQGGAGGSGGGGELTAAARAFLDKLPQNELTEAEAELREAILNFIPQHEESEGTPPPLGELVDAFKKDPLLSGYLTKTMPREVPLQVWIDHRIGGEVDVAKDSQGRDVVSLRKADQKRGGGAKNEEPSPEDKEKFFASLPEDEFSRAEEALRNKLLNFINSWKKSTPPTLQNAMGDMNVIKSRLEVLPKGCPVKLHEWIERRIGGEVEVGTNAEGQMIIGQPGTLNQAGGPQKRRRFR